MKDTLTHALIAGVAVTLTAIALNTFIIPEREREAAARIQRDAAKVGVATYLVAEDGNPLFSWRVCAGLETRQPEGKGK